MDRPKRIQFWGEDENDDRLVVEILEGKKTATVCKADEYYESDGEFDDGGLETGDLVDVFDLKQQLRCRIRITDVYPVLFGKIPERLWMGEVCQSAEHFQEAHRHCWLDNDLTDDFELVAIHFELVEIVTPKDNTR
ncbi:MAG: ASCH domain-containing protein [Anaerolineales bacterium]|nr:ASCH domain-containing protein [Anaerolineales bacterium]